MWYKGPPCRQMRQSWRRLSRHQMFQESHHLGFAPFSWYLQDIDWIWLCLDSALIPPHLQQVRFHSCSAIANFGFPYRLRQHLSDLILDKRHHHQFWAFSFFLWGSISRFPFHLLAFHDLRHDQRWASEISWGNYSLLHQLQMSQEAYSRAAGLPMSSIYFGFRIRRWLVDD